MGEIQGTCVQHGRPPHIQPVYQVQAGVGKIVLQVVDPKKIGTLGGQSSHSKAYNNWPKTSGFLAEG